MIRSPGYSSPRALTAAERAALKGDTGTTGPKGDTGAAGPKGDTGAKGESGASGSKGDTGLTGAKGDQGLKGDTGSQGAKGDTGSQGLKGDAGSAGAKGDTGSAGAKGDTGSQGAKGDTGSQGIQGVKGDTGASGATLLGTITLSETAVIAITAGTRRVTVATPAAWGVTTGQNLLCFPVSVPSGAYATHDVIPTGPNTISVGVTAPLLAVAASYSITCRIVRINAS